MRKHRTSDFAAGKAPSLLLRLGDWPKHRSARREQCCCWRNSSHKTSRRNQPSATPQTPQRFISDFIIMVRPVKTIQRHPGASPATKPSLGCPSTQHHQETCRLETLIHSAAFLFLPRSSCRHSESIQEEKPSENGKRSAKLRASMLDPAHPRT